jgi:hypothetical protein
VKYSNIFGIGDCTSLPTSKTAAAVGMATESFFHLLIITGLEELRETTKTSVRIVVPRLRFDSGTSGIKKNVFVNNTNALNSSFIGIMTLHVSGSLNSVHLLVLFTKILS